MMFSDLPLDLESEILSRVPATSLVQLQTTCKRWYVLFKDSEFVEKNLVKGKAETKVMLKQYGCDFSESINMHGIHNKFDPCNIEFKSRQSESFQISEIFHCNGLLLCTNHSSIVVWNPCTGEIRWINDMPTPKPMLHKYFLGYENNNRSCHKYKILKLNYYNSRVPGTQFGIYEFKTESWRVLDGITDDWAIESNGVTLKGNTYSFARKKKNPLLAFILKFDFTKEKFERLSLPFQSERVDDIVYLSVIKEEKLALLLVDDDDDTDLSVMKIWVTKNKSYEAKDLSWSNFLVLTYDSFEMEISFLVDEENKMVVYAEADDNDKDRTKIYVVGEDVHEEVYRGTGKGQMYNYNPLLVS